jgi:polar amino acid transport system substrate-binding protein
MMKITRALKACAVAGTLVLAATACGGSGSESEASASDNPYHLITAGTILASTSGSQPPFTVVEGGGQPTGFTIDLNNEVAKRLNLKVEYKLTTSAAGIQGLTSGQYDIVADGLGLTDERKKSISFAKGEYWSTTAALTQKSSDVTSFDDLAGKKVAVITGSVQVGYLEKIDGAVATKFETSDAAVSALNSGSVDAFLVGGPDAEEYASQFPKLEISATQPVDHATTVAFQKDNTAFVDAYNEQLEAMVKDGTFMKIYNTYFTEPPQPQLIDIWPGLAK